jgi:hypothetical protein
MKYIHSKWRIQGFGNSSRNQVLFNQGDVRRLSQLLRHGADKITDAAGGFQYSSPGKTQTLNHGPDRLNDLDAGVMRIGSAGECRLMFMLIQQLFEVGRSVAPVLVRLIQIERVGQTAPACIALQFFIFSTVRLTLLLL